MTPEQIEFHRKRFEEWFCKDFEVNMERDSSDNYRFMSAHAAWIAWISAIESIEIDIPDDDCFEYSESGITILDSGIRRGTMINSIRSIGIKVKEQK